MRVTSDFRGLIDLTTTYFRTTENMREIMDWKGSKKIFSVLDLKIDSIKSRYNYIRRSLPLFVLFWTCISILDS